MLYCVLTLNCCNVLQSQAYIRLTLIFFGRVKVKLFPSNSGPISPYIGPYREVLFMQFGQDDFAMKVASGT